VFENRVLVSIFGSEWKAAGGWIRVHNEELHNLHASQHTTLKGRDNLEDISVDGRIILNISYGNRVGGRGLVACGSG
jgi:hypothetical protein